MNKIKIISNYQSEELYSLSKEFYNDFNYEKIGVNGNGNFYSFNFLNYIITDVKYKDIDIMIYLDEDCFIVNKTEFFNLLNYFLINDLDCIGMPDGGGCPD